MIGTYRVRTFSRRFLAIGTSASILLSFAIILEASDSSTVAYNTNANITAHTVCKTVTNGSATGLSAYVPTTLASEWTSFYTNPPTGVTIGSCGCALPWGGTLSDGASVTAYAAATVPYGTSCASEIRTCSGGILSGSYTNQSCSSTSCAGTAYAGYCWYRSGNRGSCNSVCAAHNGCNSAGTVNYAGSSGTKARCTAVLGQLGFDTTPAYTLIDLGARGCHYESQGIYAGVQFSSTAASCGTAYSPSSGASSIRACACNN